MAEDRRAQLELWRQERLREKRPVQTTTVAVQRRVVAAPPKRKIAASASGRGVGASGARQATASRTPVASTTTTRTTKASTSTAKTVTTSAASDATETSAVESGRRASGESAHSRNTSLDSVASGDGDDKPARKEKRRTSFILPSPSNVPSLAGGAKRVPTPTRLTPPKTGDAAGDADAATSATLASASAALTRMEDSDESDGGFGPSPRKKKRVVAQPRRVVTVAPDMDARKPVQVEGQDETDRDVAKMFDEGETDADARSVRTTLSFGSISGPLRVLHGDLASDEDDASEFGASQVEAAAADTKEEKTAVEPAATTVRRDPVSASSVLRPAPEASEQSTLSRTSGPPQRVAMRVLASGGSLGPPRRTSMGDTTGRQSLDDTKATLTLEERLEQRRNWEMEDFVVTKNLGKGKFGNVYLAKEKHSNVSVALKVLYKSPLLLEGGLKNLQREVEIQHRLLHPNLLRLFGYFYDDSCVYLILEFASHGELYKLLSRQRYFTEAFAAHYIAQVVDALEYLHGCHVIHRDIKPENLLMGPNNTIKLADFGWSVHAPQQFAKRRTFCGTPDYLSPEVLLCQEYDHRVDVWSVGVLAYEFMFGATPFHMDNQMEMYKRIENVDFHFPSEPAVSDNAKSFISGLLKRNPADRMTLAEAKQHVWLAQRPSI